MQCRSLGWCKNEASAGEAQKLNSVMIDDSLGI